MLITPSILNANFLDMAGEIDRVSSAADWLHLDVMDGHFVPNLSFGPAMVEAVNRHSDLPIDVHLMIANPEEWVNHYVEAGADRISFHYEATKEWVEIARGLKSKGIKPGLAIKPGTDFNEVKNLIREFDLLLIMTVEPGFGGQKYINEMTHKIFLARKFISENGLDIHIQADGGINLETINDAFKAGADVFVAGSVVYKSENPAQTIQNLRNAVGG